MILDLTQQALEIIRVTSEFSNAVLVAVMPQIADVAQKLDLPVPRPVAVEHVVHCSIKPLRDWGVEIGIKGGWTFVYEHGYIDTIQGPGAFFGIQEFERIPEFFGDVKMSKTEAIQLARDTITKLGIPLESIFAEQEPRVTGPIPNGTNTIPHYQIQWFDPRSVGQSPACVEMDIDAQAGRVARVRFLTKSLWRSLPNLNAHLQRDPTSPSWPSVNPNYARQLVPFVLKAVEEYGQRLKLPVPHPLTTNHVARFRVEEDRNSPHVEVYLTNGWRFDFNHTQVNGFYAPDDLFSVYSERRPIRLKDFRGKWNMTEVEAKELVRKTVAKLGYQTNLVHFEVEPQVHKSTMPDIPRVKFYWNYIVGPNDLLQSSVSAEVDADKRELKSLYFYDQSFYNPGPKIDAPILLPDIAPPTTPMAFPIGHGPPHRPITNSVPRRNNM